MVTGGRDLVMAFLLGWTQNRNSKTAKPGPRELQGPRVAPWSVPVPLGSHLLLNSTCHGKSISSPHLPRADVSQVDEVHWLPNHGAVNPSSLLLRLGLLHHAAAQFVPKLTHIPRWFQLQADTRGPRGLLFVANQPVLTLRGNNTLCSLNQMGWEKAAILEASKESSGESQSLTQWGH